MDLPSSAYDPVPNPHKSRMETWYTYIADIGWRRMMCTSIIVIQYGIRAWDEEGNTHTEDHMEAEKSICFFQSGTNQVGHLLRGWISEDWETVINKEIVENGPPILLWLNVKVICAIIPIVVDLWMRRCEVVFGNTWKSKTKNKCDILSKKINKLKKKTNNTTGRGHLHFETHHEQEHC